MRSLPPFLLPQGYCPLSPAERAERKSKGETLVSERQDGSRFPLRPYRATENYPAFIR